MRLFQKPDSTDHVEIPEDDPAECLGNAIFWGILFWVVTISVPVWFIVDESKQSVVKNIALTVIVLDFMCAWLVAAMIKKWFKRKNLIVGISLFLLADAIYLWCIDQHVWAMTLTLVVCTTDTVLCLKALAERWLSHYDDPDPTEHKP
jgi:Na+/melibiose symporter-like transporter